MGVGLEETVAGHRWRGVRLVLAELGGFPG
jgi:hypothetical protein